MRKFVLYTLAAALLLFALVAFYGQRRATGDVMPMPAAAIAQEPDCATPPPPEAAPPAPAGLEMSAACADGSAPAPAAPATVPQGSRR